MAPLANVVNAADRETGGRHNGSQNGHRPGTSEDHSRDAFKTAPQKSSSQQSATWWARWTRRGRAKRAPPARSQGSATSGSSSPSRAPDGRPTVLKRNGSELFERAAGDAARSKSNSGLLEAIQFNLELGISWMFGGLYAFTGWLCGIRPSDADVGQTPSDDRGAGSQVRHKLSRAAYQKAHGDWDQLLKVSTAADIIRQAGYPLEEHEVVSQDGYITRMERIPNKGARDVAFFVHGVLDTSIGWVANGTTGSQAFGAWDQGFDVWLGNSRNNSPRDHQDPKMRPQATFSKYWHYSVNQLGCEDMAAQISLIDTVKRQELRQAVLVPNTDREHRNSQELPGNAFQCPIGPDMGFKRRLRRAYSVNDTKQLPEWTDSAQGLATPFGKAMREAHDRRSQSSSQQTMPQPVQEQLEETHKGASSPRSPGRRSPAKSMSEYASPRSSHAEPAGPSSGWGRLSLARRKEVRFSPEKPQGWHATTPDRISLGGTERRSHADADLSTARSQEDDALLATAASLREAELDAAVEASPGGRAGIQLREEPYRLRAIGHSLGGASLLIYVTHCRRQGRPHHIHRLILLTPAGFLITWPLIAYPFIYGMPPLNWVLRKLRPQQGVGVLVPSPLFRAIFFKLFVDMSQIPALNYLLSTGIRVAFSGDKSQWDRALQMPHYSPASMPAISWHTGIHFGQWCRTSKFRMFDMGSAAKNQQAYGQPEPPDVAAAYHLLDFPIDIMAGRADGVIAKENVLMHYEAMRKAGCRVTYKEFDFGHLDFTFAVKDDLRSYVLSRLLMPT
ncbi:hypothetical protein WJX84_003001 [Apatococcus fuscideae]|uniref:Partial AB-hydrolase lipase domain-containing protein n=1 Tax=Apatococcus fuscideae TaxID=2026836 RepID=A0AAW1RK03_9CHLO